MSVVSNKKKQLDAKNHLSSCDKNDRWQNAYFDLPDTFAEDENVDIVAYFLKFSLLKAALSCQKELKIHTMEKSPWFK